MPTLESPTDKTQGMKVLLMGPAGTGKTFSIGSLVETGIEVFYLALEPGLASLKGYFTDKKKEIPSNLHWHVLDPATASFEDMLDMAGKINTLSYDSLTKMTDPKRSRYNQFITLLSVLNNFTCHRTGESFGSVDNWGPNRALVIDGLAGINQAAMTLVVGARPAKSQPDWQVAQDLIDKLIRKLSYACACHFILIAHVERETDQVLGGSRIMPSTLGRALAPKFPSIFTEAILTVREGTSWLWDTANSQADVKATNLPFAAKNPASFIPLVERWKQRSQA